MTEGQGQQLVGEEARGVDRDRGEAEHEVDLFEVRPGMDELPAGIGGLFPFASPKTGGNGGEVFRHAFAQPGVADISGRHHHHAPGGVVAADEIEQVPPCRRGDEGGVAENRTAHGLVGIGGGDEAFAAQRAGIVIFAGDFLGDHAAFHRDVGHIVARSGQHVAEDGQRVGDRVFQAGDVIGGHFLRGEGVDLGAEAFDFDGDIERGSPFGAFEGHVFEEMGDAVLPGAFVTRAGADDDHHRGRFEIGQSGGNNRQSARQRRLFDQHARLHHGPDWSGPVPVD